MRYLRRRYRGRRFCRQSESARRSLQAGTQRDQAIPNCFGQTVECDYLSFLLAHEATQVSCPCLLAGVNHPLNVHIQLGARCLSVEPQIAEPLEKIRDLNQVRLSFLGSRPVSNGKRATVFDGSPRRLGGELEWHSGAGIGGQR